MHLGQAPHLETGSVEKSLPMARQTIDLIGMLEEKTRGNLSGEEERLVTQILFDLRMRYVELSKTKGCALRVRVRCAFGSSPPPAANTRPERPAPRLAS